METIITTLDNLLNYRATYDRELFMTPVSGSDSKVRLVIEASPVLLMSAETSAKDPALTKLRPYLNKPLKKESLMIETHDFGDSSTWGDDGSRYTLSPYSGYKLHITSVVVRFPENVDLSSNGVAFYVYKSYDGVSPVTEQHSPVITKQYTSLLELMRTSNTAFSGFSTQSTVLSDNIVEVKFRYADSDLSDFSKLSLRSSLNERITMETMEGTPLLDTAGNPISDLCYAFFNAKRVADF